MTLIGKILTFLVFFMSIVFLGFAYNVNQLNKDPKTGTSWYDVAQMRFKEAQAAKADLNARDEETRSKIRKSEGDRQLAETARKNAEQDADKARKDKEEAVTARQKAETDFANSQVALKGAQDELVKRREESGALTATLKQKEIDINGLQAKVIDSDNKRIQQQVAAATYLARLQNTERQLQDTTRELETIMEQGGSAGPRKGATEPTAINPPPDDIKGTVLSVTPDGLVAISVGSDAGLLKGHTLEVFRTEPKPFYLGTIKITDVGPHEAVGKITDPKFRKLVQPKDQVASRIVPRG